MRTKEIKPVIPLSLERSLGDLGTCVLHQANWSPGMSDSKVQGAIVAIALDWETIS